MIKQVAMYGMYCDGCDDTLNTEEYHNVVYPDPTQLYSDAEQEGWIKIGDKWYCPKCVAELFEYNEDEDVYVAKEKPYREVK